MYISWVLFIALLTLLPGNAIPDFNWDFISIDKFIHFSMFLIMAFLGALSFNKAKNNNFIKAASLSLLVAFFYGFILEYLQTFIPQRGFDYADLMANAGGTMGGILIFVLVQKRISQ